MIYVYSCFYKVNCNLGDEIYYKSLPRTKKSIANASSCRLCVCVCVCGEGGGVRGFTNPAADVYGAARAVQRTSAATLRCSYTPFVARRQAER